MEHAATPRQRELLAVIYDFIRETGYPPSFEEMRESLGVASNQSIIDLLNKLKKASFIKKDEGARSIAIHRLGYDLLGRPALAPVLGTTTAGAPAEAVEITGEWRKIPSRTERLERLQEDIFMLRVFGDSMINAGIDDGDVVLVQSKKEFVTREIVLASVDGESTIKRFISEDKPPYVYLKPENPAYSNILFTDTVELTGKVMSVLKKDQWKSVT